MNNVFRFIVGSFILTMFSFSFSQDISEESVKRSCDATAKILVKCMASIDCDKAANDLRLALSKASVLTELEKDRFVTYCKTECKKGKIFRTQGILEAAVNSEYRAIYLRCLETLSLDKENE